ncbi:dihydrolipoyl dehydrogenase 1, chloroplastic-like isoform X1 [Dioscorea cayenensis subsp. rotundata]|uniref:Dihydrolipoyl dehydrogenase 1, chloroplastic-like isoform X1 n=1 Tax=Dioscorea cayennensis subsp. rotundata TaxID=55577 RepID=A0AB40BKT7_DIOCR|nr:dihydrolipoyl dehydrogenase 1, chloroplastic-like isoform X1 [Dioscorea cayenensis subsp. rotundata]
MQASLSLSCASPVISAKSNPALGSFSKSSALRFCGLKREVLGFRSVKSVGLGRIQRSVSRTVTAALSGNGSASKGFDYDLVIIGAGVGGHGAALHAVEEVWLLCLEFPTFDYLSTV